MSAPAYDVAVVGGGLVGAAIAFGLRGLGRRLALLDEGDVAHRAARGNFGLVWVQGKGLGLPPYAAWTQRSAREWPRLAALLREETGIDVALRQPGGLHVCLSPDELSARAHRLTQWAAQAGNEAGIDVLDRAAVAARLPGIGPDVAGGTFCAQDGECNPLRLLRALHAGVARAGGAVLARRAVARVEPAPGRFVLHTAQGVLECGRVVLAAGLFLPHPHDMAGGLAALAAGVAALVMALALMETWQAKMRLLRVPALLAGGAAVALLGVVSQVAGA